MEGEAIFMAILKEKHVALSDEEIIELYWQRNESAIAETDNKYGELLFKIAYNILNDKSDSEECQNDTYLDVWNAIPPTRPRVFLAFIAKVARRNSIDLYRKKSNKKAIPSEFKTSIEELEYCLEANDKIDEELRIRELAVLINRYLRTLNEKQRFIFVGRYYFSSSIEEIARQVGTTPSNIYKSLEKIKKGLKLYLESNGVSV